MSSPCLHLLALPVELREVIFQLALAPDMTISEITQQPNDALTTWCLAKYQRASYREATQPSLLRVSVQVRREALPIFYSTNEFILHTNPFLEDYIHRWLRINQPYLKYLRRVAFWLSTPRLDGLWTAYGAREVKLLWSSQQGRWLFDENSHWLVEVRALRGAVFKSRPDPIERLNEMVDGQPHAMRIEDYMAMMSELKDMYDLWHGLAGL